MNRTPFTFYGDLLGISNAYKLSLDAAYKKLDRFYNLCFQHLKSACSGNHAKVNLFSDSIFFWGDNQRLALQLLKQLYTDLTSEGLLLRGAIVSGKLEFEPRFTIVNLEKSLPKGDILPRAVGLASSCKGARLIVDREIAHSQLPSVEWHTIEGYLQFHQHYQDIPQFDSRRFICPTPDGTAYELLYFYPISAGIPLDYDGRIRHLRNMSKMVSKEFTEHYSETISVIERSQLRAEL
jgi:hypothetical protein